MGHHGPVPTTPTIRLVTWNLQGSARPDLGAVVDVLGAVDPDVVLLQEVQRWQTRDLARRLGWHHEWVFKHWAFLVPAEGLAMLSPLPLVDVDRRVLARRRQFWSWKRRVALAARVEGSALRLVDTHLGAGVGDEERRRQAGLTVSMAGAPPSVVAGDLNTRPGSIVLDAYAEAGFADSWTQVRGDDDGPTNWSPGPRLDPPSQRLDYVLTSGCEVVAATLPSQGDHRRYGAISDHVPLVVDLSVDRG